MLKTCDAEQRSLDCWMRLPAFCPHRKTRRAAQRGAKKAKATKDRQKLFQAYRTLKAAQPDASDITIAEQLIRKRQTYGKTKNADSVKRLIDDIKQKMKDEKRSLLDMAGPRKKGRRKKER